MGDAELQKLIMDELRLIRQQMATKEDLAKVEGRMTARLDEVEGRMATKEDLAKVEGRMTTQIDGVESRMTAKINEVEGRLTSEIQRVGEAQQQDVMSLLQIMNTKIDKVHEDIDSISQIIGEHEVKIRTLSRRPV